MQISKHVRSRHRLSVFNTLIICIIWLLFIVSFLWRKLIFNIEMLPVTDQDWFSELFFKACLR